MLLADDNKKTPRAIRAMCKLSAMPIVDVEIVHEDGELPPTLPLRLADAVAKVLGSRPQGTWVKLRGLPSQHYAENGGGSETLLPVFVSIMQGKAPSADKRKEQSLALATVIAEVCERQTENVHILFEPQGAGRVAFGGELLE